MEPDDRLQVSSGAGELHCDPTAEAETERRDPRCVAFGASDKRVKRAAPDGSAVVERHRCSSCLQGWTLEHATAAVVVRAEYAVPKFRQPARSLAVERFEACATAEEEHRRTRPRARFLDDERTDHRDAIYLVGDVVFAEHCDAAFPIRSAGLNNESGGTLEEEAQRGPSVLRLMGDRPDDRYRRDLTRTEVMPIGSDCANLDG